MQAAIKHMTNTVLLTRIQVQEAPSEQSPAEECDWKEWDDVRFLTNAKAAIKYGVQLHTIRNSAALLDAADKTGARDLSFANFRWPRNVFATSNFLFCTAQQFCLAGCMRTPSFLLAFHDGSLLAVSEREAEYLTRVLRSSLLSSLSAPPALLHFEIARSSLPVEEDQPKPTCPLILGGTLPREAWPEVARGVVALQLFAGDTFYRQQMCSWYRLSSKEQDESRLQLVDEFLFGAGVSGPGRATPQLKTAMTRCQVC